jgi:hypothetical protein
LVSSSSGVPVALGRVDARMRDISLFAGDRQLLLEIDLLMMHNETGAIRLSSSERDSQRILGDDGQILATTTFY